MELFNGLTKIEDILSAKAQILNLPLGGTLELLPICNMDCQMCYIRMSREEMNRIGNLLSLQEWIQIANKAKQAGVLYFLLTGGEPLLYPDFKPLYRSLIEMGFILTINTNGTLINEEWVEFFSERPCRRINITLYGKDDKTYEKLCNHPNGFTQTIRALDLLKSKQLPFHLNFTCTLHNKDQLPELIHIANKYEVTHTTTYSLFPPSRKNLSFEQISRLTAKDAAKLKFIEMQSRTPQLSPTDLARNLLQQLSQKPRNCKNGFHCKAGRSGFWINWRGELGPCGMFSDPKENLLTQDFLVAWRKICKSYQALPNCSICEDCKLRNLCDICPAACYTETGYTDGLSEYVCELTREYTKILINTLPVVEQKEYKCYIVNT